MIIEVIIHLSIVPVSSSLCTGVTRLIYISSMVVRMFFMSKTTCFPEMIVWILVSVKINGFPIQNFVWSYHMSIVTWNWFFDFIIRFAVVFVLGVCFYQFAIVCQFVITRPCPIFVSLIALLIQFCYRCLLIPEFWTFDLCLKGGTFLFDEYMFSSEQVYESTSLTIETIKSLYINKKWKKTQCCTMYHISLINLMK